MWNPKKSALLSLAFVYFFIVILVVLEIFAPWITKSYLEITGKSLEPRARSVGLCLCLLFAAGLRLVASAVLSR